jgi:hypothetical protein
VPANADLADFEREGKDHQKLASSLNTASTRAGSAA